MVFFEPVQHLHHARTISYAAAHIICEDLLYAIALVASIFPAACFLASKAIAARRLFDVRHTAVDHCDSAGFAFLVR